ncbi:MAG: hypothetical protein EPO21_11395, partial [Chloroflexota bacterium]
AQRRTTVDGSTLYWYLSDHLGGQQRVVNAVTGQVVSTAHYLPFGEKNAARSSGTSPTAHEFTGQEFDASTDLYYYGARYYAPWLGRFVQPDTIVQDPTDPQALNRYAYGRNNPLTYIDSDGHAFWIPVIIAGLVLYGALSSPTIVNAPATGHNLYPADNYAALRGGARSYLASAPLIGDANDALAVATGQDLIYGEDLSAEERAITGGVGLLPIASGHAVRQGAKAAPKVFRAMGRVSAPLGDIEKRRFRAEASRIFYSHNPALEPLKLPVHHRIPLEWAHLFPDADPNRLTNLIGLDRATHDDVSSAWTAFRTRYARAGTEPTAADVMNQAIELDERFAEYYHYANER